MRRADAALRVIEAAYAPIGNEQAWLDGVLHELGGFDLGPWQGYTLNGGALGVVSGVQERYVPIMKAVHRILGEEAVVAAHAPSPPVDRSRARLERQARALGTTPEAIESRAGGAVPWLTGVLGFDAAGCGALLYLFGKIAIAPRTRRLLTGVAAHVASAHRLSTWLDARTAESAGAVCSTDGKLLHGDEDAVGARAALALAVKNMDRARGRLRRASPDEAMALWTAMVEGRWTLVDHVERDGKRLVLARRNESPSTVGGLRGREAQVATLAALGHGDKYIAYELGIQPSTAATYVRTALRKLRLPDRAALVRVYGPLARLASALRRRPG